MLKNIMLAVLASLLLGGCNLATLAGGLGAATSLATALGSRAPAQVGAALSMTKDEYNQANEEYTNAANLAGSLFRRGIIPPSSDPDVQRADICELVGADLARVTDEAGEIVRHGCLANNALDAMKFAFEHADPVTFAAEKVKARKAVADMNRILHAKLESSE